MFIEDLIYNLSLAYKHVLNGSKGGVIVVRFQKQDEKLKIMVSDNGAGLKDLSGLEEPSSFGYTIIHGLVQQMRGNIRFKSPDKGLQVEVLF